MEMYRMYWRSTKYRYLLIIACLFVKGLLCLIIYRSIFVFAELQKRDD
jgi:hypothetical protein